MDSDKDNNGDKFEIDVDQMLSNQNRTVENHGEQNQAPASHRSQQEQTGTLPSELKAGAAEEDNGFFITGINTAQEEDTKEEEPEPSVFTNDPVDKFKHMAVVDCSKAFSS